jgi:hypothetical protein
MGRRGEGRGVQNERRKEEKVYRMNGGEGRKNE